MEDKTLTGGPVNDAHGDNEDASKDAEDQGVNTAVSADEVEVESAESSEAGTDAQWQTGMKKVLNRGNNTLWIEDTDRTI